MLKSKIKTHKSGRVYNQPHFFILNKGLNSGKPFKHHVVNSFVFLADDEEEKEFYYFVLWGIWELRLLRPYLLGSVIEFVRLGDVVDVLQEVVNAVNTGNRKSFADVERTLSQIEVSKNNLHQQLSYLMQVRKSVFRSALRRSC